MKCRLNATLAAIALSAATLSAVAADAPSAWQEFKNFTVQQKDQAVQEAKKLVDVSEKKIDELGAQARKSGADSKAAHRQNMKELEAKKAQARVELDKLEKAGGDAWDATKTGFSNAYRDLASAYRKAVDSAK
ncbi:MAG: hypothetical protein ABIX12_05555 [Rubrivivax sp.]